MPRELPFGCIDDVKQKKRSCMQIILIGRLKMKTRNLLSNLLRRITLASAICLVACGGGGGGSGSGSTSGSTLHSVGGIVVGLTSGSSLVLQINGADNLSISANGNFTFATRLGAGSPYSIAVTTQPAGESCAVGAGSGAVAAANVTSISVTCATNSPHFAYVANYGTNDISVYSQNPQTGALTELPGSRYAAGTNPTGVAIDPSGRFLFVANIGSNDISTYLINATTGVPSQLVGSPFAGAQAPHALVVDPTGRYLYVENEGPVITLPGGGSSHGPATVSAYSINISTGALTPIAGSPYSTGIQSTGLAMDASGRYLYVAVSGGISGFSVSSSSGALTPTSNLSVIDFGGIAGSPVGEFIYHTKPSSNQLGAAMLNTDSGQLSALAESPYAAGAFPISIAVNPSGDYVFVANASSNNMSVYLADRSTGLLSAVPGSPFPTGVFPISMAVDPSGKFAYVVNSGSATISAYSINSNNGALSSLVFGPFATGSIPESIVFK